MSDSIVDPVADLANAFRTKGALKNWENICSETRLSKRVAKRILKLGEGILFARTDYGWNILEQVTESQVDNFKIKNETAIKTIIEEWEAIRIEKKKKKIPFGMTRGNRKRDLRISNQVKHGEGEDYSTESARQWSDGLTKGKRKLYTGPEGQYWTDPAFKKKEY